MKIDSFANRLKKAMEINNMKQIDLVNKTKIDKTLINKYINGVAEAKQDKLTILSEALNVNEVWLMGYDIPINDYYNCNKNKTFDELEILFDKNKNILTDDDKEYIKFIIEKRKKEIDQQLGEGE